MRIASTAPSGAESVAPAANGHTIDTATLIAQTKRCVARAALTVRRMLVWQMVIATPTRSP
jgi:hypothetical protein